MKKPIVVIIAAVLVTSAAVADEPTFESVQHDFQQKVLSLLSEEDAAFAELETKLVKFGNETFGAHPDLLRKETEKRFKSLPQFPATSLTAYVEHQSLDQFPLPPLETGWAWLMPGWDPEKLAGSVKKVLLSRELRVQQYGRLAFLNKLCPDKIYRLGKGKFPDLVVDSLGDLFVIKVEMTEAGVCKPVSVKWMKKKESPTTESTPNK